MKKIFALLLALCMVFSLAACAGSGNDGTKGTEGTKGTGATEGTKPVQVKEITLKVWGPKEDQVEGKGWLNQMLDKFEEAHPEYKITWDVGVCGEGDAGNIVKSDPSAAADVYMFANDQIGTLMQANALSKLGGSYLEQVKADNNDTLIGTVTYSDGNVYGFPMTNNTWFMYYNKDVFSEEDVKSLDTMVSKGKVAFPFGTAWYGGAFFFANGGTMFGADGLDASKGINFGGEAGYAATKKMVELFNTGNFVDDKDGLGEAGLKDGTIGAFFSGSWTYAGLDAALGDKLGAVQLPTVDIDGTQAQLKSFAGSKCVGVNPNCKEQKAAMQLAAFLASKDAQMARYESRGIIPCHKELAANDTIKSNKVAVAEMNTMSNTSTVQPLIPEMSTYWTPMGTFGGAITTGEVNLDNYKEQVDLLMESLNGSSL